MELFTIPGSKLGDSLRIRKPAIKCTVCEERKIKKENKVTGRFNHVKYDEQASEHQVTFKRWCEGLEECINDYIQSPRAKALALTRLEETYMWIGKGIRDDQIIRNGTTENQEE